MMYMISVSVLSVNRYRVKNPSDVSLPSLYCGVILNNMKHITYMNPIKIRLVSKELMPKSELW